jgi:aconitate hydratase
MPRTLAEKIIAEHLVEGEMTPGAPIALAIDHTLTQDATGTMAWLQFEALDVPQVRTERSVSYVDHNMLQTNFRNADDHRYLQSVAAKHGAYFSRPGNGICHQVQLERFAEPGKTLLGSDSHTPNAGGIGTLGIGAGGLDVAVAMAGAPFHLAMPAIVGVRLTGELSPWVTAKDVILTLLQRLSVKGGVGKIVEYYGPGVATLTVDARATICNMGAELGATASLFPSDARTRAYLAAQGREDAWRPLAADPDASYDETLTLDLGAVVPMIAQPSSPDNVVAVSELAGTPIDQVCIGSCVNASYEDLARVAAVVKGHRIHPDVSFTVTPGSRQVLTQLAETGALTALVAAGARILEAACGPCVGMGQAPPTDAVSLRSVNRNFKGRSGTADDHVHLASPETCAASVLRGVITDPRDLGAPPVAAPAPASAHADAMIQAPAARPENVRVIRGPNIKPAPVGEPVPATVEGRVLLKVGDNVTTDDIMPAGVKVLPLRSNIPAIAEYVFWRVDPDFVERAKAWDGGVLVGGENYGQGSSREHAALAPMYLGVRAVLAKSFARIHQDNLVNFGILPLIFQAPADYDTLHQGDELQIQDVPGGFQGGDLLLVRNLTQERTYTVTHTLTPRQVKVVLAGGLLNHVRQCAD